MGCAAGKLSSEKFKDSAVIGDSDLKIQTVLKLSPPETRSSRRSASRGPRAKKYRDGSNKRTPENRRKNGRSKSHCERTSKTTYDSRITAKYNIKAVIGKGSFSRVMRVEHRITKQPYALKMIEAPSGREVFEAELSVLRRVNHPNVIKLIEVFESNNKVYMVMELATGGNLLDRLEMRGCLAEEDARRVMQMVLSGVNYLHSLGITHRDLKPDNLLYYHPGNDSRIMITDFGFASTRKADGNPYMHTVCGTPQYIAPEIVLRRPYTCAVDMWAVGVIAYIVLCGSFPFDAEHDAQIFKQILKGRIAVTDPVWSEVSDEAKKFIHQLLQCDPNKRLSATQAIQHSWLTATSLSYSQSKQSKPSDYHCNSQRSTRSSGSTRSGRSLHSLRSGSRRVHAHHLEALSSDPEVLAMIKRKNTR